ALVSTAIVARPPAKPLVPGKPAKAPAMPAAGKPVKSPATPDDLTLIAGVGPQTAKTLAGLGISTYAQVAAWTKKDIADFGAKLRFPDRIVREEWVKQAKALAKGGEAEYVKVFGKKPR
ncbi:MAG: peptide ABC transporter ATP-binding protein, partial [Rhizobiaceae bacterium]